jgi:hypothetical protein
MYEVVLHPDAQDNELVQVFVVALDEVLAEGIAHRSEVYES